MLLSLYVTSLAVSMCYILCAGETMEVQYYSATLVSFPNVCFHCGTSEESLVEDDNILQLRQLYAVVRPIYLFLMPFSWQETYNQTGKQHVKET